MTERHTPAPAVAAGDPVRVQFTKWDASPHWGADVVWLGEDEHGWWLGDPVGNHWARPGFAFTSVTDNVLLAPRERGHAAMIYDQHPDVRFRVYTDITTVPRWDGLTLTAVDLDLDVIQRVDGSVFVDDEDEFAAHQVRYGYPASLVEEARAECARVHDEVCRGAAAFSEDVAAQWRGRLRAVLGR